jgi:hypothetical protein
LPYFREDPFLVGTVVSVEQGLGPSKRTLPP